MSFEPFGTGVALGGIRDPYEIKILICYLLDSMGGKLTSPQINAVFQEGQLVNYFDYTEALRTLLQSGHVIEEGEALAITPLGVSTAHTLERSLPRSIRDKVVRIAMDLIARIRREAENKVAIREVEDGVILEMRILDIGSDLLAMSLFLPDRMQAEMVAQRFMSDPAALYKKVIELFTEADCG